MPFILLWIIEQLMGFNFKIGGTENLRILHHAKNIWGSLMDFLRGKCRKNCIRVMYGKLIFHSADFKIRARWSIPINVYSRRNPSLLTDRSVISRTTALLVDVTMVGGGEVMSPQNFPKETGSLVSVGPTSNTCN